MKRLLIYLLALVFPLTAATQPWRALQAGWAISELEQIPETERAEEEPVSFARKPDALAFDACESSWSASRRCVAGGRSGGGLAKRVPATGHCWANGLRAPLRM